MRDNGLADLNANEKKRVLKRNFMASRLGADPTCGDRVFRSFGPATYNVLSPPSLDLEQSTSRKESNGDSC